MQPYLEKGTVRAHQGTEMDHTSSESEVVFLEQLLFKPTEFVLRTEPNNCA